MDCVNQTSNVISEQQVAVWSNGEGIVRCIVLLRSRVFDEAVCTPVISQVTSRVSCYLPTFTFVCLAIIEASYLSFQKVIIVYNSTWQIPYKTVSCTQYDTVSHIWLPVPHITKPLSCNGVNFFVAKSSVTVNNTFILKALFRVGPICHLAQSERIWVRRQCVVL